LAALRCGKLSFFQADRSNQAEALRANLFKAGFAGKSKGKNLPVYGSNVCAFAPNSNRFPASGSLQGIKAASRR